jgi:hypothetical protein
LLDLIAELAQVTLQMFGFTLAIHFGRLRVTKAPHGSIGLMFSDIATLTKRTFIERLKNSNRLKPALNLANKGILQSFNEDTVSVSGIGKATLKARHSINI